MLDDLGDEEVLVDTPQKLAKHNQLWGFTMNTQIRSHLFDPIATSQKRWNSNIKKSKPLSVFCISSVENICNSNSALSEEIIYLIYNRVR